MADLFLDPKVLDYQSDKYQLILYTLRWARAMKAKGSPDPMPVLIERALRDIVEQKVTKEEILSNKLPVEPPAEPIPSVVSVADEGMSEEAIAARAAAFAAADEDEEEKKKKSKKKKKEDE